ncbi:tRNA (guanosine(46)-N7)-methyltransferase TrmB [Rhodobacteraceae bacterium NNCM2]|nr:tRNA (guanosine(46)-N7)-methyltransferase TrmB [Coraliihabitans acroporae]
MPAPDRDDGAPWRNFYGRRHGKKLRQGQAALMDTLLAELAPPNIGWDENPNRDPIDLAALFPGKSAIWLEIGFGGGEHMIAQAKRYPEIGLIGAEPYINGVAALLALIERAGVENLSVTDHDARNVMDVLPTGSIGRVFLNYPDPWPKTRHHKRRFVNPDNVDQLAKVMAPGAHLRIATDIEDYVRHSLEVLIPDPRFRWLAERPGDWREPWEDWPSTRYEAKALREGRRPHYLTFERLAG